MQNQLMMLGQFNKIITLLLIILYSLFFSLLTELLRSSLSMGMERSGPVGTERSMILMTQPLDRTLNTRNPPPPTANLRTITPGVLTTQHNRNMLASSAGYVSTLVFCQDRKKLQNYFEIHLRIWRYLFSAVLLLTERAKALSCKVIWQCQIANTSLVYVKTQIKMKHHFSVFSLLIIFSSLYLL